MLSCLISTMSSHSLTPHPFAETDSHKMPTRTKPLFCMRNVALLLLVMVVAVSMAGILEGRRAGR